MARFLLILLIARQAAAEPRYATQLAHECDALMSLAVHRAYGIAWTDEAPNPKPKAGTQIVTFDPPGTAAAGFVLFWAGDLLDNPKYRQTGYDTVRGMIAARQPTGQIPSHALFHSASAGGRDSAALIADRAATRAALGLALNLLDESGGTSEVLRRDAASCFNWLVKQQPSAGSWPQSYPPATQPKDAARLMRLDTADFRDSIFAMLLAHEVLEDPRARRSVESSMHLLIRMRLGSVSRLGQTLWATAYNLDGTPSDRLPDYQRGVDVLASRNAMQALLAAYVMLGDPPNRGEDPPLVPWSRALTEAARAIEKLPKFDGKWVRLYDYDVTATPRPPSTQPTGFDKVAAPVAPSQWSDTFGLDTLIDDVLNLPDAGREKFRAAVSANFSLRQRLAAALCGLENEPMSTEWPVRNEDVAPYLKEHAAKFQSLDEPIPTLLSDRVRRLYLLLQRAKLEKRS